MKTKQIPSIIMLLAGAVSLITMYIKRYELKTLLTVLLLVLVAAYIVGLVIKKILDKFVAPALEEQEPEGDVIEKEADDKAKTGAESESQPEAGKDTAEK